VKKSTVHLFVFDTMSDWEYGYLIAGINNPQFQRTPPAIRSQCSSASTASGCSRATQISWRPFNGRAHDEAHVSSGGV
jgi:hypothetical protein